MKYVTEPDHILLRWATASVVRDFLTYRVKAGIAIAAKMPMMATTIINSTKVKPLAFRRPIVPRKNQDTANVPLAQGEANLLNQLGKVVVEPLCRLASHATVFVLTG